MKKLIVFALVVWGVLALAQWLGRQREIVQKAKTRQAQPPVPFDPDSIRYVEPPQIKRQMPPLPPIYRQQPAGSLFAARNQRMPRAERTLPPLTRESVTAMVRRSQLRNYECPQARAKLAEMLAVAGNPSLGYRRDGRWLTSAEVSAAITQTRRFIAENCSQ